MNLENTISYFKSYADDAMITAKIRAMFATEDPITSFNIYVETHNSVVTLTGKVPNQNALEKASNMAENIKEVKKVISKLVIEPRYII